jgi:DNA modification methylase
MSYLLLQGNALHIPLADKSVHMCVTSPPYWGLRDYQTARWEGGNPECDHVESGTNRGKRDELPNAPAGWAERAQGNPHRDQCRKCGARRIDNQLGLEPTPELYCERMVAVFREVKRVLRDNGCLFVNIGDSYAGSGKGPTGHNGIGNQTKRQGFDSPDIAIPVGLKPKDMVGIPWKLAFALRDDGWYLRSEITWCKTSPMPESCHDRPTSATEKLFLLTKQERYFYDIDAVRVPSAASTLERDKSTRITNGKDGAYSVQHDHETPSHPGGRNLWNYWVLSSESYNGAHFATYPRKLVEPCIKAGTSEKGCCAVCGNPWVREVEDSPEYAAIKQSRRGTKGYESRGLEAGNRFGSETAGLTKSQRTIGWRPTCTHDAPIVPCTVFDPFSGSSTTGVVATALGRHYVGLELNPEYIEMGRRRIERPHRKIIRQRATESFPLFKE